MIMPEIILYSREDCCLCHDMFLQLKELQLEYNFSIIIRYVDHDKSWIEKYGSKVPVITINDIEICNYYLDLKSLKEHLGFL